MVLPKSVRPARKVLVGQQLHFGRDIKLIHGVNIHKKNKIGGHHMVSFSIDKMEIVVHQQKLGSGDAHKEQYMIDRRSLFSTQCHTCIPTHVLI